MNERGDVAGNVQIGGGQRAAVWDVSACDPQGAGPFVDVGGAQQFCADIEWLARAGITGGYGDGTFRPTAPISRQAMAAFLYRMEHPSDPTPSCSTAPYGDVPVDHPFCGEIAWMLEAGIAASAEAFRPADAISRQAMSAFLWRLAGEPAGPFPDPGLSDVDGDHVFVTAIWWMADAGITGGYTDGTFRPTAPVTRQAMAAFLRRYEGG